MSMEFKKQYVIFGGNQCFGNCDTREQAMAWCAGFRREEEKQRLVFVEPNRLLILECEALEYDKPVWEERATGTV